LRSPRARHDAARRKSLEQHAGIAEGSYSNTFPPLPSLSLPQYRRAIDPRPALRSLLLLSICVFAHPPARAGAASAPAAPILGELSASDQEKVLAGQQVLVTNTIAGMAWPEAVIFQKLAAPPEAVAAAFTDYAQMPEIIPTVLSANLLSTSGADQVIVYTTKVPVLKKISYTVCNHIAKGPGGISIRWTLLKSSCASSGSGGVIIEPVEGGSVIRYANKVVPSFPGASLLRSVAVRQASDTVSSIAAYLDRVAMR
jgi:hypothetical protein